MKILLIFAINPLKYAKGLLLLYVVLRVCGATSIAFPPPNIWIHFQHEIHTAYLFKKKNTYGLLGTLNGENRYYFSVILVSFFLFSIDDMR